MRRVEKTAKTGTCKPQGRRQTQAWIPGGLGHADLGIGRRHIALGGGDIRAPAQDINGPGLVTYRRECRDGGDDREFIGVAAGLRAHQHVEAIDLCVERNL